MRGVARRPLQPDDSNVPKTPSSRLRRVCQRSQSSGDKPETRRRSRPMYSRNVASESFVAREFLCIPTSGIGTRRCQVDGRRQEISDPDARIPSRLEISNPRRNHMRTFARGIEIPPLFSDKGSHPISAARPASRRGALSTPGSASPRT